MRWTQSLGALVLGGTLTGGVNAQQPLLQLQGQPYFGGSMTLHVTAPGALGQPVTLLMGVNPLPVDGPVATAKGNYYVGTLLSVIPIGVIPANAVLTLPFVMPPHDPVLVGLTLALQAYLPGMLSTPATLPLDAPYLVNATSLHIESPEPEVQALFGDQVAMGDLNADGHNDVIVGAWFQDVGGHDKAGAAFVLWGPTFTTHTSLKPPVARPNGNFGLSLTVEDYDRDGIDDLVVGETTGLPALPGVHGQLHIYWGGSTFLAQPGLSVASAGDGETYAGFARFMTSGDLNADGWPDLAVMVPAEVLGLASAGRVDVYWGPGFTTLSEVISPDNSSFSYFGTELSVGDVNGDGMDDLVEGSGRDDVGGTVNLGSVHIFLGPDLQWFKTIAAPANYGFNTRFGEGLHATDLDGDGKAEVMVCDLRNNVYVFDVADSVSWVKATKPPINGAMPPLTGDIFFGELSLTAAAIGGDALPDLVIPDFAEGLVAGCGVIGKGGRIYFALQPYFNTYHVLDNPAPQCGDQHGWWSCFGQLDDDASLEAVLGNPTSDELVPNGGNIVLYNVNG